MPPVIINADDTILEEALREALDKPNGNISKQDCSNFGSMEITYMNASNQTAIIFRDTNGNVISDTRYDGIANNFSLLAQMTNLTKFVYSFEFSDKEKVSNLYFDMKSLETLKNLTSITFETFTDKHYFNLFNTGVLKDLPNLKELFFDFCKGVDFNSIGKITSLTHLTLASVGISDITCLSGLVNLEWLVLNNFYFERKVHDRINNVKDLSPIRNMKKLKRLSFVANLVEDISVVRELPALTDLDCRSNKITDFSSVAGLSIAVNKDDQSGKGFKLIIF